MLKMLWHVHVVVFLLNFCDFRVNREMGWKAAEKLIRHWKVLRGDNVSQAKSSTIYIVACSFPLFTFYFEIIIIIIIIVIDSSHIHSFVTGYDNKG